MALATAVPTSKQTAAYGKFLEAIGTIAIGASPLTYATGGIVLNFGSDPLIKSQRAPLMVTVQGISGYVYSYVPGTDNTNGLLKVFVQDATATNPLAEIAAAAVPAGVSGDTISFRAEFLGQN